MIDIRRQELINLNRKKLLAPAYQINLCISIDFQLFALLAVYLSHASSFLVVWIGKNRHKLSNYVFALNACWLLLYTHIFDVWAQR